MISYNPHVSVKVLESSLFTRYVVNEVYHQTIKYQLTHQPACCNFMETIARTFSIPSEQNQFIRELFSTMKGTAIAMNTGLAFTENFIKTFSSPEFLFART